MKMKYTSPGAQQVTIDPAKLEFLRLPKPGHECPITGMSRGAINELILPTKRNDHKPPVKSYCLRQKGAKTGIRIVDFKSLRAYILAHADGPSS